MTRIIDSQGGENSTQLSEISAPSSLFGQFMNYIPQTIVQLSTNITATTTNYFIQPTETATTNSSSSTITSSHISTAGTENESSFFTIVIPLSLLFCFFGSIVCLFLETVVNTGNTNNTEKMENTMLYMQAYSLPPSTTISTNNEIFTTQQPQENNPYNHNNNNKNNNSYNNDNNNFNTAYQNQPTADTNPNINQQNNNATSSGNPNVNIVQYNSQQDGKLGRIKNLWNKYFSKSTQQNSRKTILVIGLYNEDVDMVSGLLRDICGDDQNAPIIVAFPVKTTKISDFNNASLVVLCVAPDNRRYIVYDKYDSNDWSFLLRHARDRTSKLVMFEC